MRKRFNNRGNALLELKRFEEALASYDQALEIKPDYADALQQPWQSRCRAQALRGGAGELRPGAGAQARLRRALNNRGNALQELKRFEEALASYDRALALKPDYAEALNNRGIALQELKRLEEALASYDRALALKPDYAEALNNRGNALQELKRLEEALASYDQRAHAQARLCRTPSTTVATPCRSSSGSKKRWRATTVRSHAARLCRGVLQSRQNPARTKAVRGGAGELRSCADVAGRLAEAFFKRGNILRKLKRFEEAIASYDRALALKPDHAHAFSGIA